MRERRAKILAALAALAVAALAGLVVVYPGIRDFPLGDDVYARRAVTDRVVTDGPDGEVVELNTKEASDSTVERVLGEGGLLLVRVACSAGVAFLTGAVVYRVLRGRYGFTTTDRAPKPTPVGGGSTKVSTDEAA